jgi:hypothetical protein
MIRKDNAARDLIVLGNAALPRPLSMLASRPELSSWLSRVLVYTLIPGLSQSITAPIHLPNNLVAFFTLLYRLPSIGYPSHWLTEFVQTLLDDNLVTDASPYVDSWPIPLSDHIRRRVSMRKVTLQPWMIEIETILALTHQCFPFSIDLSSKSGISNEDIGIFEATFTLTVPLELILDRRPVVSLLIFKSPNGGDGVEFLRVMHRVLDGRAQPASGSGTFFVLTALDCFDITSHKIRFRLGRKRVVQMEKEGTWFLAAYRTDTQVPCEYFNSYHSVIKF